MGIVKIMIDENTTLDVKLDEIDRVIAELVAKVNELDLKVNPQTPPVTEVNDVIAKGAKGDGVTDDSQYFSATMPNQIQAGKICAINADAYRNLISNRTPSQAFVGDGQLRILNFQVSWEIDPSRLQGTVYPKDMDDAVIMSMNLPNEGVPYNAQQKQQRAGSYSYPVLRSDIASIVPWGQTFLKTGTSFATGNYVKIENMTVLVYRNSTQRWDILGTSKNGETSIMGKWVDVNYSEDGTMLSAKNANYTTIPNGIRLCLDNSDSRYGFHFWMYRNDLFRFGIDPSDIKYIVTYVDVTAETEEGANCLVADMGCDAYTGTNGSGNIYEVGVGGFINVSTTTRRCYFTNLAYNSYFDYCNQQIIDNIQ